MNIGVIGLGYVGLTFSIVGAMKGFNVYGIEVNNEIVNCLNENKAHFYEPGLDNLIEYYNNKNFFLVDKFNQNINISAFVLTVGTPLKSDNVSPNYDYILSALETIKDVYTGKELIILRSTVSVGTTKSIIIPYLSRLSGVNEENILVAFCPERTIEGRAINELQELPQIIGANNEQSMKIAEKIFREITPTIIRADSIEAAELIKLFNNTYRDINFAVGNIFNFIAQSFGLDGVKLIHAANIGYQRSSIPLPGFVGGPCLEKDAYILTSNLEQLEGKKFIMNARKYNESLEDIVVEWVENVYNKLNIEKKIAISGLAFKGIPDTSDLRGSNSVNIARKLFDKGYIVMLHDFYAKSTDIENLKIGDVYDDIYRMVKDVGMLLILNNNRRYSSININKITENMKSPKIIFDSWKCMSFFNEYQDARIYNIGNINIFKEI